MLSDDETTYVDYCCDEAEKKDKKWCQDQCTSILSGLMKGSEDVIKKLFYYIMVCIYEDGHLTKWEYELVVPLAAKAGYVLNEYRDMDIWFRTRDMRDVRKKVVDCIKAHLRGCDKKTKEIFLQIGVLSGACDGRVNEHERLFLLDIFGKDYH